MCVTTLNSETREISSGDIRVNESDAMRFGSWLLPSKPAAGAVLAWEGWWRDEEWWTRPRTPLDDDEEDMPLSTRCKARLCLCSFAPPPSLLCTLSLLLVRSGHSSVWRSGGVK